MSSNERQGEPRGQRRGRLFRRGFLGFHALIAGAFCVLITLGVVRGLTEIRGPKPAAPLGALACVEQVEGLREELLDRLAAFSHSRSAAEEADAFGPWAMGFRGRYADAKARCSPPKDASREQARAVAQAFEAVRRALDLSEIQATHWSRHLGPALDESADALRQARGLASRP